MVEMLQCTALIQLLSSIYACN